MKNSPNKPRKKIGLLGGNGQVATEVATFAALQGACDVICFVRADYGAVLLKTLGISYRVIDYTNIQSDDVAALQQCDLIADFSYPTDQQKQNSLETIERNSKAVMKCLRTEAHYVYMSSFMAFGMPSKAEQIHDFRVPRSAYAWIKRSAERLIFTLARRYGLRAYNFRLGQVHGQLQSVTKEYRQLMREGSLVVNGHPDSVSNIVFTHSIYHALLKCAEGTVPSRTTYSLVCSPQWRWSEVFKFYEDVFALSCHIRYQGFARTDQAFLKAVFARAVSARDIIEPFLLRFFPSVMPLLKGEFRKKIAIMGREITGKPDICNIFGVAPGLAMDGIHSSFDETRSAQQDVRRFLNNALPTAEYSIKMPV
jgi:nucleoside-diphosphate-sugar epimerase